MSLCDDQGIFATDKEMARRRSRELVPDCRTDGFISGSLILYHIIRNYKARLYYPKI